MKAGLKVSAVFCVRLVGDVTIDEAPASRMHWLFCCVPATPGVSGPSAVVPASSNRYSEFDGYDPLTFERTDTRDNSRNRLDAGRVWAEYQNRSSDWRGHVGLSLLGSSNRNFLADAPVLPINEVVDVGPSGQRDVTQGAE